MKYDHINDYRFIDVMAALGEASGQESTPFKEKIYAQGLDDIHIDHIESAAWAIIKTRTFASFPKIGELRDAVGGKSEDNAEVQAAAVWQAIKKYGSARSVVFDDAVTMAVIQQAFGGWCKLCSELMEDQLQWFIKDFSKHYIAFKRSNISHVGLLGGWCDPIGGKGPALIGNQQKALAILGQAHELPIVDGFSVAQLADKMGI